ncbi:hypothetical protein P4O66_021661 [Electrophorus voltai]|uniref:C2H2-type domain-containing protein n=1 Tax=Electrophorus voltai TaxID=2609070 RepID=A0AAD8ZQL4_9TELE|nr:hypothetical protein P4O66_021661 [Electrophorus voltai]
MDFHICRDFEAVNVKTVGTDLSNDDTINRGHVQSNLTNEEHFDTKFNFKEEGEFQKEHWDLVAVVVEIEVVVVVEELEDIMPLSFLPKVESIHTTGQDQGHCGGEHHVLQEGVNSLLVIIKTEPDPEEISPSVHSSGKRHTLQDSADMSNPISSCRAPSVPKEMWDYESKGESQRTLEDWSSSLVVVKMEPDEGEAISSGEHSTEPELGEKSSLPPLWKAEPDDPNMPYPAFDRGDPQPRLCMSSVQRADRSDSPEENEDLISSSQSRRLSSAISPGKELNGLKSYSCTECGNTFSKSSSFYRHMRIHTANYYCSVKCQVFDCSERPGNNKSMVTLELQPGKGSSQKHGQPTAPTRTGEQPRERSAYSSNQDKGAAKSMVSLQLQPGQGSSQKHGQPTAPTRTGEQPRERSFVFGADEREENVLQLYQS